MIYGIGLPKTGTTTLIEALKILGYRDDEIVVGDFVYFLPRSEIGQKTILTVRKDTDTWFKSIDSWSLRFKDRKRLRNQRKRMYGYEMPQGHENHFKARYERHNERMVEFHNPLVVCWERGDGWEKLCKYLNKPIPNIPFPHLNKQNHGSEIT